MPTIEFIYDDDNYEEKTEHRCTKRIVSKKLELDQIFDAFEEFLHGSGFEFTDYIGFVKTRKL
jgi:hypothetical protein